ncbi:DUF6473 family protein [Wenxinia saemankumensis]|uniref:DUF6473 domain-containing protein n=1 Tax=Wenxinia saemankumensis TaxID=1447782 RepID=A0A1M6EDZ7_9RHOB|nr:DUF6473 family protein [Wenxinia saemankumensis]SHI83705.1 hypothetical protein SAMN05444417_1956 [Wenxinia saemankumensis]
MALARVRLPDDGWPTCTYGASRLRFRGPPRPLTGGYIACLGGGDTIGGEVRRPWPEVLERALARPCLNLGLANASPDAFLNDPGLLDLVRGAELTVIEAVGAQNMTNRLYAVHPRRNDRFIGARPPLEALFPEVDFADFCFTRHMLGTLAGLSRRRFSIVRAELQQAWIGRMRQLIAAAGGRAVLAWLAPAAPPRGPEEGGTLGPDPLFVTAEMLSALRGDLAALWIRPAPGPGDSEDRRHDRIGAALAGLSGPLLEAQAGQEGAYSFSVSSGTAVKRSATSP